MQCKKIWGVSVSNCEFKIFSDFLKMAHKYSKDRQWTQLGAHCQKDLKIIIIIILNQQVEFKATLSTATRSNILF